MLHKCSEQDESEVSGCLCNLVQLLEAVQLNQTSPASRGTLATGARSSFFSDSLAGFITLC